MVKRWGRITNRLHTDEIIGCMIRRRSRKNSLESRSGCVCFRSMDESRVPESGTRGLLLCIQGIESAIFTPSRSFFCSPSLSLFFFSLLLSRRLLLFNRRFFFFFFFFSIIYTPGCKLITLNIHIKEYHHLQWRKQHPTTVQSRLHPSLRLLFHRHPIRKQRYSANTSSSRQTDRLTYQFFIASKRASREAR